MLQKESNCSSDQESTTKSVNNYVSASLVWKLVHQTKRVVEDATATVLDFALGHMEGKAHVPAYRLPEIS